MYRDGGGDLHHHMCTSTCTSCVLLWLPNLLLSLLYLSHLGTWPWSTYWVDVLLLTRKKSSTHKKPCKVRMGPVVTYYYVLSHFRGPYFFCCLRSCHPDSQVNYRMAYIRIQDRNRSGSSLTHPSSTDQNILNHFIHWFFTRIFVFFTMLSSRLPTPREVLTPKPYLVWNWHRIKTRVWIQGSASWLKGAGPSAAVSMGTEFRLVVGDSSLGTRVGQISYWAHRRYSSGCQRISFEFTSCPMQVSAVRKLYADVDIRWSLKRTRERVCVCVRE